MKLIYEPAVRLLTGNVRILRGLNGNWMPDD